MADKEATVYIVDVGTSMSNKNNGRSETDFDFAMTYVWDKITSTASTFQLDELGHSLICLALERKTATVGVIGLRTDDTANELAGEESFENISVLQDISQILLKDLKQLRQRIRLSSTGNGDAISAIVIAIQMITKYCKKLKYKRKIVLVTDGRGSLDADESSILEITRKITQDGIELVIVGVDFDDPEYGFKEEAKDVRKSRNESIFKELAESCGGVFGNLQQAVDELGIPRLKSTRPVPSYTGKLTLGDPEKYETALVIDVERYPRTMVRRPLTASQYVHRSDQANDSVQLPKAGLPASDVGYADSDLTNVKNIRTYQVSDERAPGGKRDVGRDDMAKGYEYGRTAVHITESDENVTKLETEAGLDIIGFVPWSKFDRFMSMSVTSIIIAQRTNSKANIALSSLIHALYELESYAIARLVSKVNRAPVIILLAPSIKIDYECLLDVQIPYAEDIRSYKFPPLDRIETVSGKVIKQHRNIPSEALQSAMDDFVDEMNLATLGEDEDGKVAEYMPITDTYSPVLHRIDQAVRWRAVHPIEHIPPPYEILTRYSNPPEQLVIQSKSRLEKLITVTDVKKVPPKFQGRKRHRDEIKPVSGLNVDALLGGATKKSKVSLQNPIPDFRQILDTTDTVEGIQDAVDQLGNVIEEQVKNSFGDITYGRVVEELGVIREEMVELEMPEIYNNFVKQFKRKLLDEELGGNRKDLWWEMKKNRIGLIEKRTSERSEVTEEEAKKFGNASL